MPDIHVRLQNNLLWLILDRPPLNSLTIEMLDQLTNTIYRAEKQNPQLVILTSLGDQAFCTGVDLPDDSEDTRSQLLQAASKLDQAIMTLHARRIPTVAIVKHSAFGAGCELAILCRIIIARADATFRLPSITSKIFSSATSIHLPAAIGQEETRRLMQNRSTLSAQEALHLGLVQQVLPEQRFVTDTEELLVLLSHVGMGI